MGRWSYSSRQEADGLKKIQLWRIKKYGFLSGWGNAGTIKWTHSFSGSESSVGIQTLVHGEEQYLKIYYTQTDSDDTKRDFDYKIPLTTTPCYFGGKRYWFVCPWYANGVYCGRRVGVLYLGGNYFACRHCYNLTYNSRNLSGYSKVAGQVISIPELEKLRESVRCEYYAGKMTRRYKRYLRKQEKSLFQLRVMAGAFGKI